MTTHIEITGTHAPFENGHRIAVTKHAGSMQVGIDKQYNALIAEFRSGSPVLVDAAGLQVCGPIDIDGARGLARSVLSGDPRAITGPQTTLSLALALFHVLDTLDFADANFVTGCDWEEAEEEDVSHG
ncbi:hypothetical protein [Ciceribacter ferrooxidans]|uniref:Uncharacterized protein n=1 Tax=Ciceribacter ferrooxidans TaxID=2509717 RepID=A0A4Q2SWA5_9HYPH|nr:hypothetical protein [Ciceribacter ferrooxidans]RYC10142.1 hypothetical protein EUU22_18925 [Ciceribacter ferrooxidans]